MVWIGAWISGIAFENQLDNSSPDSNSMIFHVNFGNRTRTMKPDKIEYM